MAGGVLRHAGNAALAASMANCIVARLANATLWMAWPVDGLKTSAVRSLALIRSPLIRCWIVLMQNS
ncbi:hypothetical protein D3C81_2027310 [compost metagenome]